MACDWKKICKLGFLIITAILGVVGVALTIAGGVSTFKADVNDLRADGNDFETLLAPFIDCDQVKRTTNFSYPEDHDYVMVKEMACRVPQIGYTFLFVIGGVMSLFFVVAATWSALKGGKLSAWTFTIFAGLSFAVLCVGIAQMAILTSPVWKTIFWCKHLDATSVQRLQDDGFICMDTGCSGEECWSVIHWLNAVGLYFGGAGCLLASMLMFYIMNGCCASKQAAGEESSIPMYGATAASAPAQPKQAPLSYQQGSTLV